MRYGLIALLMIGTAHAAQTFTVMPPIEEWTPKCANDIEEIMASGRTDSEVQAAVRRYFASIEQAYEKACTREIFRRIKARHR